MSRVWRRGQWGMGVGAGRWPGIFPAPANKFQLMCVPTYSYNIESERKNSNEMSFCRQTATGSQVKYDRINGMLCPPVYRVRVCAHLSRAFAENKAKRWDTEKACYLVFVQPNEESSCPRLAAREVKETTSNLVRYTRMKLSSCTERFLSSSFIFTLFLHLKWTIVYECCTHPPSPYLSSIWPFVSNRRYLFSSVLPMYTSATNLHRHPDKKKNNNMHLFKWNTAWDILRSLVTLFSCLFIAHITQLAERRYGGHTHTQFTWVWACVLCIECSPSRPSKSKRK